MSLHQQNFSRSLKTVAIFAPGLIGASLGMALTGRRHLRIWSRNESSAQVAARTLGADFASSDPREVVAGADEVVLCTPVEVMPGLAQSFVDALKESAVVTDAGSVKAAVVAQLESILGVRYVGAHPMAGSEKSGLAAARADLFQGAACMLTPTSKSTPATIKQVEALWREVGCRVFQMSPAEHDQIVACTSHLPHAVASCLVETLARRNPEWQQFAGSGYRDTTRVAAGSPEMWTGIFRENREQVRLAVGDLIVQLQAFSDLLARDDAASLRELLDKTRDLRRNLFTSHESV